MKATDSISPAQMEALLRQSNQTLAEWWCKLNSWEWPEALPEQEEPRYRAGGRRSQIMWWIMDRVGHRLCLRVWNKDMPDDVFESFWRKEREPGTPYGDYHAARSAKWKAAWEAKENATLSADVILDDVLDAEVLDLGPEATN